MMNHYLTSLLILSSAAAFSPMPVSPRKTRLVLHEYDETHISFNPMEGYKSVNEERAKECAEHFGECTVLEMESLRDNLHKERLQNIVLGVEGKVPSAKALEHRLMEEDLDLQLHLLQEHLHHDPKKFPEVEAAMKELPHLKDNTFQQDAEGMIHKAEHELVMAETVLEESVLETMAMCAVVAALIVAPQIALF